MILLMTKIPMHCHPHFSVTYSEAPSNNECAPSYSNITILIPVPYQIFLSALYSKIPQQLQSNQNILLHFL